MPIIYQKKVNDHAWLGVWHITESFGELTKNLLEVDINSIKETFVESKKLETAATRLMTAILCEKAGVEYYGLEKDEFGKPHLTETTDLKVSISHAFPYATAIINREVHTGVDIERPREQILRIKHKFLSDIELKQCNTDIDKLTQYWCAKECLYKIHGRRSLIFRRHLRLEDVSNDHILGHIEFEEAYEKHLLAIERIDQHWIVFKSD